LIFPIAYVWIRSFLFPLFPDASSISLHRIDVTRGLISDPVKLSVVFQSLLPQSLFSLAARSAVFFPLSDQFPPPLFFLISPMTLFRLHRLLLCRWANLGCLIDLMDRTRFLMWRASRPYLQLCQVPSFPLGFDENLHYLPGFLRFPASPTAFFFLDDSPPLSVFLAPKARARSFSPLTALLFFHFLEPHLGVCCTEKAT